MSGFSGINQFGSLTTRSGQRLTFKDFDKDGDGTITQEEYESVFKEMNLDSVELSTVDKNGDKTISEDEFAIWEQKTEMQNAVNDMASTISRDFAGKTQYLTELTTALKEYIEEFAASYTGDVSGMAEAFKAALPAKYEQLKSSVLANDPDTVKSAVLEEIYAELTTPTIDTKSGNQTEAVSAEAAKRIGKELEAEADKFIKTYTGNNLEADLKAHLEAFMNQTDAEKLAGAAAAYNAGAAVFGGLIDSNELKQLKEYAKEFLTAALEAGVTVKLNGTTIKTSSAITTALNKFTDGDELKAAMKEIIDGLSTTPLKDSIIAEEKAKAQEAAEKQFTDINGESYKVNASLIDYSGIEGYFENTKYHERGKGWSGSRDKAYNKGVELLNNESLKSQMKAQIQSMLESKGISFDKIENIFENVYNQSVQDTLNAEGMITGRGARGLSRKGHAYLNVKDCVDAFITTFNTNIAKAVDEMNASNTDFDTIDLDYSQAGKDENGNALVDDNGNDLSALYATGKTVTTRKRGADYYVKYAEQMIDNMKAQMLKKAMNMCKANGIEFDNSVFETMFNNAKSIAVNAAVTGINADGTSFGGIAGGVAAAGVGTVGGLAATGALTTAVTTSYLGSTVTGVSSTVLGVSMASSAVPVVGWAVAGAAAIAGVCSVLFGGHHSESSFNAKTLLDTFTEQFKTSYTAWVEAEKAEAKKS